MRTHAVPTEASAHGSTSSVTTISASPAHASFGFLSVSKKLRMKIGGGGDEEGARFSLADSTDPATRLADRNGRSRKDACNHRAGEEASLRIASATSWLKRATARLWAAASAS